MSSLHFIDKSYCMDFMSNLMKMRDDSFCTDVNLKVQDTLIPCHKIILCAASPYFHAMFSSGLEESISSEVEIKSTDAATVFLLVKYIYSAEIEINIHNVQSLIQSCDQFQFDRLRDACEKFMQQHVEPGNCIGFYKFAQLYGLKDLLRNARRCMLTKFKDVVTSSSEFIELTEVDLTEYLSDDMLDVPNENIVFEAAVAWTKTNTERRQSSFPNIARYVRFPFCTGAYLCHVVSKETLMADVLCQQFLDEANACHMVPGHEHESLSPRALPRSSFNTDRQLVVLGGLLKDERENKFCWYLKEDSASWELLAQLPRPCWKFYSACVTHEGILVTGGYYGNVKTECWLFDTTEKRWKVLPSMNSARCKHQSVLHDNAVYVVGGEDDMDRPLASMEKFDVKRYQWINMASMQKPLSDPLVISFGSNIFVMSGIEYDDTSSSCTQELDTVWERWHFRAPMPEPCRLGAAIRLGDKIFVIGGYTRSCMSYHPLSDTWAVLANPREKHGNAPAVVWKGKILVGGGDVEFNDTVSIIEEYDPVANSWSYWKLPLKEELSCHCMLNVDLCGL